MPDTLYNEEKIDEMLPETQPVLDTPLVNDSQSLGGTIQSGTVKDRVVIVETPSDVIQDRANMPWNKFYLLGNKNDGMVTSGTGTHTESRFYDITRLSSTSAVGEYSRITTGAGGFYEWLTDCEFSGEVKFSQLTGYSAFIGVAGRLAAADPDTNGDIAIGGDTGQHIGFVVDSTGKLYVSNGNTAFVDKEEITGIILNTYNRYRVVFDRGVDIKFYINEVLVATHIKTNTFPTAGGANKYGPELKLCDFGNAVKQMDIFNTLVFSFNKS